MRNKVLILFLLFGLGISRAHADAAVLLAEPYGGFGSVNPTGHAAVYLSRVCAKSPVELRRCEPGEMGVVVSRYHRVGGYDWIAIPLIPYLYAVENAGDVPLYADSEHVEMLRDQYRRAHLRELVPDAENGEVPKGDWYQLVGSAYDRKIFAFEIETSEEQDDALIADFNSRKNKEHFNLFYRNCADFTRGVINFYYPKALKRSIVADLGITTPKHIAKSMVRFSRKHPELESSAFMIPQIPGNRPPSKDARGVLESLVRSKKYAVPLLVTHAWLLPTFATGYLTTGRFNPEKYAETAYSPADLEQKAILAAAPKSEPVDLLVSQEDHAKAHIEQGGSQAGSMDTHEKALLQ